MQRDDKDKSLNVFRFLSLHGGLSGWFVLAGLATLISVAAGFLMPQIIRFVVDVVIGGEAPSAMMRPFTAWLGSGNTRRSLLAGAVGVVLLSLLSGVFNFIARLGSAKGTERFVKQLRDTLYKHIQYLPFKWHVENSTGDIIQRCTSDLETVRNFLSNQLLEVVRTLFLIVVALALMFTMNVRLSLVALIYVPVVVSYTMLFFKQIRRRFIEADEAEGQLTAAVQENLTGVRVVRAFGREKYELTRFDKFNNYFAALWVRLGKVQSYYWGVGDVVTGMQILLVVVIGAVMCAGGTLSIGAYLVFVSYNQMLAWPVRALGRTLTMMSQTGVSARRLQDILDADEEPAQPEAVKPDLNTDIRFEDVTFGYDTEPVLKDLNFTIKKGSTFGILGATGSGKSTLTYLLNRLYELPEGFGNIWFGEHDIRTIDRHYLRKNVGLVLQEPFLFSKTIEDNIAIATPAKERHKVRLAAHMADLETTVNEFHHGYDTMVGERGMALSGGQMQRVAIARTLILDAPIIVFDDSLSAVDLETDARIRKALAENTQDATVILISHRINTLMQADQILVLENGEVAALGTHQELIEKPGLYKRIYDLQARSAEAE